MPADDLPADDAALQIANVFQDAVVESAGGRAIPECPGHVHPASLRRTEAGLAWRCPLLDPPVAD